jgi:protein arginine N-methyltransferase 5
MQSEKRNKTEEIAFETPYVVMFQQVNLLSGNPDPNAALAGSKAGPRIQECWSFEHPRRDMVTDDVGK